MHPVKRTTWLFAIIFFIALIFFMPVGMHEYDKSCWLEWSGTMLEKGLGRIYDDNTNYMPGHLIQMRMLTFFYSTPEELALNIYQLKYMTVLADIAGALILASLASSPLSQFLLMIVVLLNPAFMHNTLLWGQMDTVFSTLVFASLIALHRNRLLPGCILFLAAFNFKVQAVLFLPLILFLLILKTKEKPSTRVVLKFVFALAITQFLFLLPFILMGRISGFLKVFHQAGGGFSYVSLHADNIWNLILPGNLRWTGDFNTFYGQNYKTWGLIMSAVFLLIVFIPMIRMFWKKIRHQHFNLTMEQVFLTGSLSVMAFFYFNTQMHERYTFPAFLLIAAYSFLSRRWWIYLIFSAMYFLNNEKALNAFSIDMNRICFDDQFISIGYLLLILLLMYELYFQSIRLKPGLQKQGSN